MRTNKQENGLEVLDKTEGKNAALRILNDRYLFLDTYLDKNIIVEYVKADDRFTIFDIEDYLNSHVTITSPATVEGFKNVINKNVIKNHENYNRLRNYENFPISKVEQNLNSVKQVLDNHKVKENTGDLAIGLYNDMYFIKDNNSGKSFYKYDSKSNKFSYFSNFFDMISNYCNEHDLDIERYRRANIEGAIRYLAHVKEVSVFEFNNSCERDYEVLARIYKENEYTINVLLSNGLKVKTLSDNSIFNSYFSYLEQ